MFSNRENHQQLEVTFARGVLPLNGQKIQPKHFFDKPYKNCM